MKRYQVYRNEVGGDRPCEYLGHTDAIDGRSAIQDIVRRLGYGSGLYHSGNKARVEDGAGWVTLQAVKV